MNEDDPTKGLPSEGPVPDTAPMLERILTEVINTREMLTARIETVEHKIERLTDEMRAYNKRAWNLETEVAQIERRVETLEGQNP